MSTKYSEVWDLDGLFPGGSESKELRVHMDETEPKLERFEKISRNFTVPQKASDAEQVAEVLEEVKNLMLHIHQSGAFIGCLQAQNTEDKKALLLHSESSRLSARFDSALQKIQQDLTKTDDQIWNDLMKDNTLNEFAFVLNEWRDEAKQLLSEKEENLITTLSIDGYHSWSQLYDMLVGDIKI